MTMQQMGPTATNPVANSYVRELGYVADVRGGVTGDGLVSCTFGALPATGNAVVVGQPMSVGVATIAPWGQVITVTGACDVHGYDYLGQPMMETFGGATEGSKAFKWVTMITAAQTAVWSDNFGLPYMAKSATTETLVAADLTDPATATTGDPRGTVVFDTPPDGVTEQLFTYTPYRTDVDGIKTMHGVRHFYPPTPVV